MKLRINKAGLLVLSIAALAITGVPAIALGESNTHGNAHAVENSGPISPDSIDNNGDTKKMKEDPKTKLSEGKLMSCQKREASISNIMARVSDRSQKQLDLFSTIADKTEAFYVKRGVTLTNYAALVADVTTQKAAAQTTIDSVKATSVQFKCDGTDPKAVISSFKLQLKAEIAALKTYKTSVKNLIVGVKSVQSDATAQNESTATDTTAPQVNQ